jgi:Apea-like HEPN
VKSDEAMREAFIALLELGRENYEATIKARPASSFTMHPRLPVIVDGTSGGRWRSDEQLVEISRASMDIRLWRKFDRRMRDAVLDIAADIIAAHSARLPFWVWQVGGFEGELLDLPAGPVDFKSEPTVWVARHLVVPAVLGYILSLPSADKPDPALADRIVREALDTASSSHLKMTSCIPVIGIEASTAYLASGDVVVRQLSPTERGAWFEYLYNRTPFPRPDTLPLVKIDYHGSLPSHMIEMTVKVGRMEGPSPGSLHKQLLCAVSLHGYPLAGPGQMFSISAPQWLADARLETPVQISPRSASVKELSTEALDAIAKTFNRLRSYNLDRPVNSRDLALHRFLLGSTRESPVDALLDYIIALECFLLPSDPATRHADLSYRFRLHGAHYLGTSTKDRKAIWRTLRELYDIRSRLVHDADYPTQLEIEKSSLEARDIACSALLKAVSTHFPRVEEFNNWSLQRELHPSGE